MPSLSLSRRSSGVLHAVLAGLILSLWTVPAMAADSAVFLMYHRFGDGRYPATNVRLDQFEAHIEILTGGGYTVLPAAEIVAALRTGKPLPERTVGITVDDAFLSVYAEAFPRLRAAGLPFTLFVATDPVNQGRADYMSWDQLREMRDAGVDIGAHTGSHLHMADVGPARNRAEIRRSLKRLNEELGVKPVLFAYPYGEAGLAVARVVGEFGFAAAFGQHSAATHKAADPLYLPRFPLNEKYSDPDDFTLRINTVGLPVRDMTPSDIYLRDGNPPAVGFTVDDSVRSLAGLACYHSQFGLVAHEVLGKRRVEIRFPEPFAAGRSRLNCTKPAADGRWYWLGMQYYVPRS